MSASEWTSEWPELTSRFLVVPGDSEAIAGRDGVELKARVVRIAIIQEEERKENSVMKRWMDE